MPQTGVSQTSWCFDDEEEKQHPNELTLQFVQILHQKADEEAL